MKRGNLAFIMAMMLTSCTGVFDNTYDELPENSNTDEGFSHL